MAASYLRRAIPVTEPINGRPKGLRVERSGSLLSIDFAWRGLGYLGISLAAIGLGIAGGCLCTWGWILIPLGSGLILLAAGLAWLGAAGLVNHTPISAGDGLVRVRHGPIPWPGRDLKAADILQFYCITRELGRSFGPLARVMVATEDGRHRPITWFMPPASANWAIHIEEVLEEHLEIANRPIICPACGYDLRATLRRCPGCGHRIRSTKRQRRAWAAHRAEVLRRGNGT